MNTSLVHRFVILIVAIATHPTLHGQTAKVQFIHASPDPVVNTVDIWLDSVKIVDNLNFRNATAFLEITPGVTHTISIADSGSTSSNNPIFSTSDSLGQNELYIMTFHGLSDSMAGYSPYQPLGLSVRANVRSVSLNSGSTDILMINAVSDAEPIKVTENREALGILVGGLEYTAYSDYIEFYPSLFRFRLSDGSIPRVMTEVNLALMDMDLEDSAVVILISGFEQPEENNLGPSVKLSLYTGSGVAIELPKSFGKIQIIHNSIDPGIDKIDVYSQDTRIINDLNFRSASGYIQVPSAVNLRIAFTHDTATSALSALFTDTVVLSAEKTYIGILTGEKVPVTSAGEPLNFSVSASKTSALSQETEMIFHHGCSDFGMTSIYESSILNSYLVQNTNFGSFTEYVNLPYSDYTIDLIAEVDESVFATYALNLEQFNLGGEAITLLTSGLSDTTAGSGYPRLGLFMARSVSGMMIELPLSVGINTLGQSQIKVYPNPSNGILHIRSNRRLGELSLHNLSGQVVYQEFIHANYAHLDLQKLVTGIYLLEVMDGDAIYRQRIVIDR